jgi:hypothetical protein
VPETNQGAVEITLEDGVWFVILPIHEVGNRTTIFRVEDPGRDVAHLLSAADVRGSWSWVGELVTDEQLVREVPDGVEIY